MYQHPWYEQILQDIMCDFKAKTLNFKQLNFNLVVLYYENQQAFRCSITTATWRGVFPTIHYNISAGQAKVPDSHITVLSMEENVPWLWGEK